MGRCDRCQLTLESSFHRRHFGRRRVPGPVRPREPDVVKAFLRYGDGCEVSSSCFTCPLPVCRHDEPGVKVAPFLRSGLTACEIAEQTGVSRRTVQRIRAIERQRGGG